MTTDEVKTIAMKNDCLLGACPFLTGASPGSECFTCEAEVPE